MNVKRLVSKRNSDKLNILTFPTHERYETNLAKTGHNFYSFHLPDSKKWTHEQLPPPPNYHILPEGDLCDYIKYDLILSQSKFWQFQVASQINKHLNLPMISLEHTVPTSNAHSQDQINAFSSMVGHVNIFISNYSQQVWGINQNPVIIRHGVDTEMFYDEGKQRGSGVTTVANEFQSRDYCLNFTLWKEVIRGFDVTLAGNNPGLSASAKDTHDLRSIYNKNYIYFNSTNLSPIPTTILEAMACGCAIVSADTCAIGEFVTHGENGFLSNDPNELRSYIETLRNDTELAKKMGAANVAKIRNELSLGNFVHNWNNLFKQVVEVFK